MKVTAGAVIVALLLHIPAFALGQTQKASVSGVVLNADGEPLPNIRVTLGKLGVNVDALTRNFVGERDTTLNTDTLKSMLQSFSGIPDAAAAVAVLRSMRLEEIHELTIDPTGVSSIVYTSSPPVMMDSRGRFSFDAVDPGTYRVTFSGSGYAKQDYG